MSFIKYAIAFVFVCYQAYSIERLQIKDGQILDLYKQEYAGHSFDDVICASDTAYDDYYCKTKENQSLEHSFIEDAMVKCLAVLLYYKLYYDQINTARSRFCGNNDMPDMLPSEECRLLDMCLQYFLIDYPEERDVKEILKKIQPVHTHLIGQVDKLSKSERIRQ